MANVVIALFVLSFLYYTCECFPCYRDECQSGVQYCVAERKRCYLCKDRLHQCGTTSIPKDCIVLCEHVKLTSRVSNLNNTVAELKKVNTEQKQQLSKANATIQEKIISWKDEEEKLQVKGRELVQYQESLTASDKTNKRLNNAIVQLTRELGKWKILCGILPVVVAVCIGIMALLVWKKFLRPKQNSKDCRLERGYSKTESEDFKTEREDLLSKTETDCQDFSKSENNADQLASNQLTNTSSKSPISAIDSTMGVNNTHSSSETVSTDSGYGIGNKQSMKSKIGVEVVDVNTENQVELKKITSIANGNVNLSLANTNSLVINNNTFTSATKDTDDNAAEKSCTNPPTNYPPTPPTNHPTNYPPTPPTNHPKGIAPTTDDSGKMHYTCL